MIGAGQELEVDAVDGKGGFEVGRMAIATASSSGGVLRTEPSRGGGKLVRGTGGCYIAIGS